MFLSFKFKKANIWASVLFGVVCAVVFPIFSISTFYLFLVKILTGIVMVFILKRYANFRQFLITCIVFFTITFLFGGLCIGINSMFGINLVGGQILINGFSFPVSVFVLFASIYLYLFIQLMKYTKHRETLENFYFDVQIFLNNKQYFLRGYLDSGNKLLDNGNPVVVIPLKVFVKIFSDYPIEKVPLGIAPNNPHYLKTLSVGGPNKILVIEIEKFLMTNNERNKEYTNVKLGLSKANFSSDSDVLLHSSF
jgi:stage II sporulation protein GA (sporulation sigma-E factor processing peptidase)